MVVSKSGAQVDFIADLPKKERNEIETAQLVTVFASVLGITASRRPDSPFGFAQGRLGRLSPQELTHVSRQSPNSRRRKRTAQSSGRVQARARREVWAAILHHELRRQGCSSLSLRGMGADRAETRGSLHFQSYEEEVSRPHELLGSAGRDGRTGPALDSATAARIGADQGRSGRDRAADISGSAQPGAVSPGDRGRQVHA